MNATIRENVTKYLDKFDRRLSLATKKGVQDASVRFTNYVKTKYLSAPYKAGSGYPNKLAKRSGKLYSSTVPLQVKRVSTGVYEGGVAIGNSLGTFTYANVLVSKRPKTTVIKGHPNLLIPFPGSPAISTSGVQKIFSGWDVPNAVFLDGILASKEGNSITPYFIVKKSVTIHSKIHTNKIANEYNLPTYNIISKYIREATARAH
jgi:hypothetical protein